MTAGRLCGTGDEEVGLYGIQGHGQNRQNPAMKLGSRKGEGTESTLLPPMIWDTLAPIRVDSKQSSKGFMVFHKALLDVTLQH